jgi:nucleoside-diphosphate-sugar epimerase
MKVILTGSTGFIGREVLEQCLQNTRISSIIALSRRDFPPALTRNPKLKVLVIKDFLSYPPTVLQEIQGAEACIWYPLPYPTNVARSALDLHEMLIHKNERTLGKARMPDNETNKRVSIDYTLAAARAFKESLSSQPETISNNNTEFRFIYLSGAAAERDQTKSLWFMQDYRRIRVFALFSPQIYFETKHRS